MQAELRRPGGTAEGCFVEGATKAEIAMERSCARGHWAHPDGWGTLLLRPAEADWCAEATPCHAGLLDGRGRSVSNAGSI